MSDQQESDIVGFIPTGIEEVYRKFMHGDHIDDNEMTALRNVCQRASKLLRALGPTFSLATKELNRVASDCDMYLSVRKQMKKSDR